jgi:uncharacterized protein
MTNKESIIQQTAHYVLQTLQGAEGGHDWWHIERVWKLAKKISLTENADIFIVELAALLHDIADSKFHNGDEELGAIKASEYLNSLQLDAPSIEHVINIINNISFKGGKELVTFKSIELDIVQDADRLDAIGAIGIARTFNYGGFKNREIYNPNIAPNLAMTKEEYKKSTAPTINHFYEKLLLLKDRMNTSTAQIIAEKRHAFMELYLDEFYKEWEGER